jgi:hypothetical protein
MSYEFYKVLHLVGVFMILTSVSALTIHVIGGGTKLTTPMRKGLMAVHGMGLLIVLVAGFGLLARLGLARSGIPPWVIVKLVIWLYFAAATMFLYRTTKYAKGFWFKIIVLASLAAYFAIYKPI